ncbi:hypothetical protein RB623_29105, partial [Mesorhizobium sp. LHD-90]|nr:hypothetical protein [Mesorhizobium sp. LHD-90]
PSSASVAPVLPPLSRPPAAPAPRPPELLPVRPTVKPEPIRTAPSAPTQPSASRPAPPPTPPAPRVDSAAAADDDLDDALLKELEVSLDSSETRGGKPQSAPSLDEEMAKLLGELSNPRR